MTAPFAEQSLWTDTPMADTSAIRLDNDALKHRSIRTMLSEDERRLLVNLLGEKRREAFIAGRLAAKHRIWIALGSDAGMQLADFDIGRRPDGAPVPRVRGARVDDVSVSITHGGAFAMAGAVRNERLGLDVEPVSIKCRTLRSAFAVDEELEVMLRDVPKAEESRAFTRLFSAKEAAAKCLGTHMYYAFHHYRLVSVSPSALEFRDTSADRAFSVETAVQDDHVFSKLKLPKPN